MKIYISSIGNSKGLVIPSPILKVLKLNEVGMELEFEIVDGKLVFTPTQNKKKQIKKGA